MRRREFLATAGTAAGAVAAAGGAADSAAAQETHTVEMTDSLVFDPEELTVAPGDTVVWENVGSTPHTVTAYEDEIPEEAAYFASGGFSSESAARSGYPGEGAIGGGETYEHTFEVEGSYGYFCIPHEGAGMVGTIEVTQGGGGGGGGGGDGGGGGGGEGGGEVDPEEMGVPFQAHWVGLSTILGVVVALVFTFYVLKYGESSHASDPNRK